MTDVDFYFDVMCPWAYQTSKWIREARQQRDIAVRWRFFSLEEVNRLDGKKHPWEREWSYGWSMLRVAALLRRRPGPDGSDGSDGSDGNGTVDRFYEVAGRMLHDDSLKVHSPAGMAAVLEEIGEDPGLVDEAVADATTHDDVRADHAEALRLGGYGVPTLVLDPAGPAPDTFFGPVITPAPTGEEAGLLWDAVVAWRRFPRLYEMRRPKVEEDWLHIQDSFSPYLNARDWQTIQNPVA